MEIDTEQLKTDVWRYRIRVGTYWNIGFRPTKSSAEQAAREDAKLMRLFF